jgi:hypothetical protein
MAMNVWTTRADELVGIGDMVALGLLEHSDAVGRIVTETDDGQIRCMLVRCNSCEPGSLVTVDEEQLLLRVCS